jgi:hypothetical protein
MLDEEKLNDGDWRITPVSFFQLISPYISGSTFHFSTGFPCEPLNNFFFDRPTAGEEPNPFWVKK